MQCARNRTTSLPLLFIAAFSLLLFTPLPAAGQAPVEQTTTSEPGAPAAEQSELPPVTTMRWPGADQPMAMDHERPKTFEGRLTAWLGMWHPAVIHFPIALILTAGLLEALAAIRRKPLLASANKILIGIAAVGAFVAAPLGWLSAGLPSLDDSIAMDIHRWTGTGLPFLLLLVWWLKPNAGASPARGAMYASALVFSMLVILVQAYFGAELTHGANHLAF